MFSLSLNYKSADILLREKFCFEDKKVQLLLSILKANNIKECVYLSTCNRCELYGTGDMYNALKILSDFAGAGCEKVKGNFFFYDDYSAIKHLFFVCCGFDSMALGEDEILGQVKKAFEFSQNNHFTDFEMNTVFKAAITTAKKVKTNTLISKRSVSVATLTAAKCHKFISKSKKVLLVGGSGDIGSKVVKNLVSYNEFNIYATSRKHHLINNSINIIPYENRYDYLNDADIIISATKSPHYIFTADRVKNAVENDKPRLFIDLAVPRDIDEEIDLIDNCILFTIDGLKKIADENKKIKADELKSAEDIINNDMDELIKTLSFHKLLPEIEKIEDRNLKHFIYLFRDNADSKELESFINVFSKMEGTI